MMRSKKENAPAGITVPNAGAQVNYQIQNTPGVCRRQALFDKRKIQNLEVIAGEITGEVVYKPTCYHYQKARTKAAVALARQYGEQNFMEIAKRFPESLRKFLYAAVKSIGRIEKWDLKTDDELVYATYQHLSLLMDIFDTMTPGQIMQLFPVSKTYDGERWQRKDYYSTMEEIKNVGIDTVIGEDKAAEFLMEYENPDIRKFMVTFMLVVSRMRVLQGGNDVLEEFLEKQGVPCYTYYEKEDILLNPKTGGVVKVEKPRTRIPKHMKVIKGGLRE